MIRPSRARLAGLGGLAALLLLAAALAALGRLGADAGEAHTAVTAVVDGDTIRVALDGRVERVRYIGIDAPERRSGQPSDPWARQATAANRALVANRTVRLEFDVQERDRHGRLLAYVWVDGVMVNAELVRRGYAQTLTVPPNVRYAELFAALEREARAARRGLWTER